MRNDGPKLRRIVLFFRRMVHVGGAERTMFEEALYFQRKGIEASILTFSHSREALFDPPYPVRVTQLGSISGGRLHGLLAEGRNILLLRRALRRLRPDIVLASSGIDCIVLFFATLGLGIPYAAHIHGTIFWFDSRFFTSWLRYATIHKGVYDEIRASVIGHREFVPATPPPMGPVRRIAVEIVARTLAASIRKARVLFTLTRHMAWEVKRLYGRDAIPIKGAVSRRLLTYVPRQDKRHELGLDGQRIVLNVNRLDARKRVELAIRAFDRLAAVHPDIHLVVGGTGPEESRLKDLVSKLGRDQRITFVGFIPEIELADYLAMCDVFVHPNWAEFAISPYEALALQRKVVWSSEMEMEDDIGGSGHVFSASPTVEGFAEALDRALRADVRTVVDLSRYTWEAYAEQVLRGLMRGVRPEST